MFLKDTDTLLTTLTKAQAMNDYRHMAKCSVLYNVRLFVVGFTHCSDRTYRYIQEFSHILHRHMAKCFLDLGTAYRDAGRTTKAIYYLKRFDNLVGGDDDLYEAFDKQDSQAMQWIDTILLITLACIATLVVSLALFSAIALIELNCSFSFRMLSAIS